MPSGAHAHEDLQAQITVLQSTLATQAQQITTLTHALVGHAGDLSLVDVELFTQIDQVRADLNAHIAAHP